MNEAYGSEIRDGLGTILLRQQYDVGCVDDLEVGCRQLGEGVNDPHELALDGVPARPQKGDGEAVRAWCLIRWHVINRVLDLKLRERQAKIIQGVKSGVQNGPIEVQLARGGRPKA